MRTAREEAKMRRNLQPTAKNQRGVKRVRNNNVSQPNAKRVNTNRNKLFQNLKNKEIPNLNIQRLMKSYDNKTKTANQIIREANNLSKTLANRNKLIQNLKKKNLPNYVIKGLVGSYDNKTKTANQIIREANNFGKTFAAGITAQRMETLRPRG